MSHLECLRLSKGFTQEFIAKQIGVATSTYSQYENGIRSVPLEKATAISDVLGCQVEDIFLPSKFTVSKLDEEN